jgi:hypothetical protein
MACSGGVVLRSYATLQGATREKETREREVRRIGERERKHLKT